MRPPLAPTLTTERPGAIGFQENGRKSQRSPSPLGTRRNIEFRRRPKPDAERRSAAAARLWLAVVFDPRGAPVWSPVLGIAGFNEAGEQVNAHSAWEWRSFPSFSAQTLQTALGPSKPEGFEGPDPY